jgi:putative ATP-binding cassette transporter
VREDETRVAYEQLTLLAAGSNAVLVKELSVSVPHGTRVLIVGPNEATNVALFRATAGVWPNGRGRIVRPGLDAILFLPERPYLPPGTLRDVLVRRGREEIGDEQIANVLHGLVLESVVQRTGGLDVERDWDDALSLGEQQLLCVAGVVLAAPRFVFLERPRAALGSEQVDRILSLLSERSITYLTLGNGSDRLGDYDAILELAGDGGWTWKSGEAGRQGVAKSAEGT